MLQAFVDQLAQNLALVVTLAVVVGVGAGGFLLWRARARHIKGLRRKLLGQIPLSDEILEALKKVFTPQAVEAGAVGAVTFVDVAWHYTLADPSIWDHFDGPAADHIADAIANLDVVGGAFGTLGERLLAGLRAIEISQTFGDLLDAVPTLGDSTAVVLEAKQETVVDALMDGAASTDALADGATAPAGGLLLHIPLVTIGFASYRAWRRSTTGTEITRNLEFATIEVVTRAGGGLAGAKVGGTVGTFIAPGVGTVIGTVAGAVAGTLGGAALGEGVKKRHIERASRDLNQSLEELGRQYLDDDAQFERLTGVFKAQEQQYLDSLNSTRRRLRRYNTPWRALWPDEKLVLLQETVSLAESRLGELRQGTVEAIEKLTFIRNQGQYRELGVMLWSTPVLCDQLGCSEGVTEQIAEANDRLQHELVQLGSPA